MHNLLKRQLKIYFGDSLQVPTEWQELVNAVNDAYMQSDVDRGMLERSLDLSSQELLHANSEMRALISLLSATIESTADGILVVNRESKIVTFNQKFVEMWHFPQQILESRNDERALLFVIDQLKDPEVFLSKVRELYANPEAESYDKLLFKDGRVVERYSKPQRIGQAIVGRVWSFRDITKHERAEESLAKEKIFTDSMISSLPGIFYLLDENGKLLRWNENLEIISGYSPKEISKMNTLDFFAGEEKKLAEDTMKEVFIKGESSVEANVVSKDGRRTAFFLTGIRFISDNQNFLVGMGIDMAARKIAEERLVRSEEYFRALIENSSDVIIIVDKKGTITYISPSIERFLGYKPKELIGKSGFNFILPADLPRAIYDFGKAIITKEVNVPNAFRVRHKDGSERILEGVGRNLFDNPAVEGFVINARDVSEHKQDEAALRTSESQLSNAVKIAKLGHWEYDVASDLFTFNDHFYAIFRTTAEEVGGYMMSSAQYAERFVHPDDMSLVSAAIQKAIETDDPLYSRQIEHRIIYADGETGYISARFFIVKDDRGKTVKTYGASQDITERKKMEEALRASEAELHDAYFAEATINMILGESLENIPFEEFLQKALNMILSLPWIAFEPIGSISLVEDKADVLVMKAQSNIPEPLKKQCTRVPFGKCLCGNAAQTQKMQFADHIDECHEIYLKGIRPHSHYSVPILFGGRTLGVLNLYLKEGHIRDKKEEEFMGAVADTLAVIIARKHAEDEKEKLHAQLLQAQKMEVVGQLAGGIAHDFNNILTAMIGYGHLLKMKMKEDDPLRTYADHILSLSDKAANLTQSLLAFSRKQIMNPRPVDLNEIMRRIDHLLSRIIGEDIQLQTTLSENDLIVMADPGHIEQVLMNLATNAKDAMPEGGLLTIGTEKIDIDHEFIKEHGFGNEGQYALISLIDTGAGMDKETREKIFEPFFTTKEVGKGTGLGLSMVYGIIKQHDGYINVYSEPGMGTAFRIYLPLIEAQVDEIKPEVIQPFEKYTETVLLAEDEEAIREFIKKLLEEYGYKVITAASGQEAINEFKAHKDKIQLLLLDVIMPNRNGREAYEEIKKIRPDIRVLFMSGYPADIIHKHDIIEKGFAYIEKPASPTKLLKKIREVIER